MLRTMLSLIYLFPSLFFGLHFFLSKKLVNFPTLENELFLFELTFITCFICPCLHLHTLFFFISFIKFVGMFHINTFLLIAINNDVFNLLNTFTLYFREKSNKFSSGCGSRKFCFKNFTTVFQNCFLLNQKDRWVHTRNTMQIKFKIV